MNSNGTSLLWILAPIALFVAVILWGILNTRKRTQDLAAAAPQIGFTFMGDTWRGPTLNPRHKTCLLQRTRGSFKNAMVGSAGHLQAIIFDYTYRMGKSTVTQTLACFSVETAASTVCPQAGRRLRPHRERSRSQRHQFRFPPRLLPPLHFEEPR
jgi:hypothetical protein